MRDPEGRLTMTDGEVVRALAVPVDADHFLRSALAADLVHQGKLLAFALRDAQTAVASRLRFVSQPTEWCDAQLFDAASLTLDIQQQATAASFDLKDASAWNILFVGTQPVFCDLLSFQAHSRDKWWAAGQFARHFIVPLWLAQQRGLHALDSFKCWRDGVDPQQARTLLGIKRYLHRCWPLVAAATATGVAGNAPAVSPSPNPGAGPITERSRTFRTRLYASLRWMLDGVRPTAGRAANASLWSGYTGDRHHYPASSLTHKQQQVRAWLMQLVATQPAPAWVLDLGCNTGEFSAMALDAGAQVIAVDADHACIQRLYLAHPGQPRLHPVVAAVDDLSGGRGWAGTEQAGLPSRLAGSADLVLMLALLHHLAVGASVPLDEIARFARACTRRWLIVEWIHPDDPQLTLLARQRCREPVEFSLQRQRQAFVDAGFVVCSELPRAPAARTLALLQATASA